MNSFLFAVGQIMRPSIQKSDFPQRPDFSESDACAVLSGAINQQNVRAVIGHR